MLLIPLILYVLACVNCSSSVTFDDSTGLLYFIKQLKDEDLSTKIQIAELIDMANKYQEYAMKSGGDQGLTSGVISAQYIGGLIGSMEGRRQGKKMLMEMELPDYDTERLSDVFQHFGGMYGVLKGLQAGVNQGKVQGQYKGKVMGYFAGTWAVNEDNSIALGRDAGENIGNLMGGYYGKTLGNSSVTKSLTDLRKFISQGISKYMHLDPEYPIPQKLIQTYNGKQTSIYAYYASFAGWQAGFVAAARQANINATDQINLYSYKFGQQLALDFNASTTIDQIQQENIFKNCPIKAQEGAQYLIVDNWSVNSVILGATLGSLRALQSAASVSTISEAVSKGDTEGQKAGKLAGEMAGHIEGYTVVFSQKEQILAYARKTCLDLDGSGQYAATPAEVYQRAFQAGQNAGADAGEAAGKQAGKQRGGDAGEQAGVKAAEDITKGKSWSKDAINKIIDAAKKAGRNAGQLVGETAGAQQGRAAGAEAGGQAASAIAKSMKSLEVADKEGKRIGKEEGKKRGELVGNDCGQINGSDAGQQAATNAVMKKIKELKLKL